MFFEVIGGLSSIKGLGGSYMKNFNVDSSYDCYNRLIVKFNRWGSRCFNNIPIISHKSIYQGYDEIKPTLSKDFTIKLYYHLLKTLVDSGYSLLTVKSYIEKDNNGGMCAIMRHDVDIDCATALYMAELESRLGIKAT